MSYTTLIPTRGRPDHLKRCVDSLKGDRIIVGYCDESDIAELDPHDDHVTPVKMLWGNIAQKRNAMICLAEGDDIILFVDDDVTMLDNAEDRIVSGILAPGVSVLSVWVGDSGATSLGQPGAIPTFGYTYALKKSDIVDAGMYDPRLPLYEDVDLAIRLYIKGYYIHRSNILVEHTPTISGGVRNRSWRDCIESLRIIEEKYPGVITPYKEASAGNRFSVSINAYVATFYQTMVRNKAAMVTCDRGIQWLR